MGKLANFFQKIKSIKNIELYFALALGIVVIAIVFFSNPTEEKNTENALEQSYIQQMENKLVTVLGNIDGVGNVEVAISYCNEGEKVYAYETTTTQNGSEVVQTTQMVMVKGEPILLKTLTPQITGVLIVASNVDAVAKYKIVQAVVTLLDIDSSCVQVFS